MDIFKSKWLLLTSFFLFVNIMLAYFLTNTVLAQENLDYEGLKKIIEATHGARKELLDYSTGKVRVKLDKKVKGGEEADEKLQQRFKKKFSIEQDIRSISGQNEWTVQWYKKKSKNRYDMVIPEMTGTEKGSASIPTDKRIVVTPEKGIYYNATTKKGYINDPPNICRNPSYIERHFDIDFCYHIFRGGDLVSILEYFEKGELKPDIQKSIVNGQNCIKLDYDREEKTDDNKTKKWKICIWISPEISYSVVKAQRFSNLATGYNELKLLESYEATYEEAKNHKGEWILKSAQRFEGNSILDELISFEFEDVNIGVEIDDDTFTFEGLGVPPGTKIHDKSGIGQPVTYYYKSYPIGDVDDLMSIVKKTAVDDANSIQSPIFIPCMKHALKESEPYIYDLKEGKFIEKVRRLEEAYDQLINEKTNFIAWDDAFLVSKEIKLSPIGDKDRTQFRLSEGEFIYAYYLPEEFELPMQIKWETKQGNGSKYLITVKKIDLNGLWISDITIVVK